LSIDDVDNDAADYAVSRMSTKFGERAFVLMDSVTRTLPKSPQSGWLSYKYIVYFAQRAAKTETPYTKHKK